MIKRLLKRILPMPAVNVEYSEQRLLSEITSLKNEIKTVKALLEKSEVELKLVHDNQNNRFCNICGYAGENFGTSGNDVPIFKRLHIVGGGIRKYSICPSCGSFDRSRWLFHVLKNKTPLFYAGGTVLHFAPEKAVSDKIISFGNIEYYTGDIQKGAAMHITDITNIQYKDEFFDYVICNHVMEHILDEEKAVQEIKRVLKDNGRWVFSIPICTDYEKTFEDDSITTAEERWEKYCQGDHVRLYGMDFKQRFEQYGLNLEIFSPCNELTKKEIETNGFINDDIMIVARKK